MTFYTLKINLKDNINKKKMLMKNVHLLKTD